MFRASRCLGLSILAFAACGDDRTATNNFGDVFTTASGTTGAPATTATASTSSTSSAGSETGTTAAATTGAPDPTTSSGTAGATSSTTGPVATTGGTTGGTTGDDLCKPNIDLVFVMDVSTSMYDVLSTLADEILVVDAAIAALDVEVDVQYGLVVFVDDFTLVDGGAPYLDAAPLQADFIEWSMFTQSNSQTDGQGSNEDFPENTLDALHAAATGFAWRPLDDTVRLVIHTTDDTFGDKGAIQSGEVVQHSYDETVLALQEREIRVFVFADNDMTGGGGDNQDVSMGFFTPYEGKTPIPDATDGGAFNLNDVYKQKISLSAAINQSVVDSLCSVYIPM